MGEVTRSDVTRSEAQPFEAPGSEAPAGAEATPIVETRGLTVTAQGRPILRNVELAVRPRQVFGLIGPSGAGKSTLLKCMNRLIDLIPNLRVEGDVLFHGSSIYRNGTDVDALRARVGILFQQPVVFPRSIVQNVVFGAARLRRMSRRQLTDLAEQSLRQAALWDEVEHRLHEPALRLSVGQQQRLCLARTLAVGSEVILMDEPTSALDPKATEAIETLILELKERHTIVLVTHNLAQARRVTDRLAFIAPREGSGQLVESGERDAMLAHPQSKELIAYLAQGDV